MITEKEIHRRSKKLGSFFKLGLLEWEARREYQAKRVAVWIDVRSTQECKKPDFGVGELLRGQDERYCGCVEEEGDSP
jgi:phage terminase large subunit-like protein